MIEQILYTRNDGYKQYASKNISEDECDTVINKVHQISNFIQQNNTNNEPKYIFKQEYGSHRYIAKLGYVRQGGRLSVDHHVLVMEEQEYLQRLSHPELLFDFSKQNFRSSRVDNSGNLSSIDEFILDNDNDFKINDIVNQYNLNNQSFHQFLSTLYYSLLFRKQYKFGIYMENVRNRDKVFRNFGYAIFSLLPLELRKNINIGSSTAPRSSNIDIQIVNQSDRLTELDVYYNIDTGELKYLKQCEYRDFYVDQFIKFDENQINNYFEQIDKFIQYFGKNVSNQDYYVLLKAAMLYNDPSLFERESSKNQLEFVDDLLTASVENQIVLYKFAIKLLSKIDKQEHVAVFRRNYLLYKNLNDRELKKEIFSDLICRFNESADNEKIEFFHYVFESEHDHQNVIELLMNFMDICSDDTIIHCSREIMLLYKELNVKSVRNKICERLFNLFETCSDKKRVQLFNLSLELHLLQIIFIFLSEKHLNFQENVLDLLVNLYDELHNSKYKDLTTIIKTRIFEVLTNKKDDTYICENILKWIEKDSQNLDDIFVEAIEMIDNYLILKDNTFFMNWMKKRYYVTSVEQLKKIYLSYLLSSDISKIEEKIDELYEKHRNLGNDDVIIVKNIYKLVASENMYLKIDKLNKYMKMFCAYDDIQKLYSYLENTYFDLDDESQEIYALLQEHYPQIYNDPQLKKGDYPTYDKYFSNQLHEKKISSVSDLVKIVNCCQNNKYKRLSYQTIISLYNDNQRKIISSYQLDTEKYDYITKQKKELLSCKTIPFIWDYKALFYENMIDSFWDSSTYETFDYKEKYIYKELNFQHKYDQHDNYKLVKQFDDFLEYTDWDEIYKYFFETNAVDNQESRKNIVKQFIYEYENIDNQNTNYIALCNVDFDHCTLNCQKYFNELAKTGIILDKTIINQLNILNYIDTDEKTVLKELKKYKNYQSDYPSYSTVNRLILLMNVMGYLAVIINSYFYNNNLKIMKDLTARNMYLLVNYACYLVIVILLTLMVLFCVKDITKRISNRFKLEVLLDLTISYIFIALCIWLTLLINQIAISIVVSGFFLAATVGLHYRVIKKIKVVRTEYLNKIRQSEGGEWDELL